MGVSLGGAVGRRGEWGGADRNGADLIPLEAEGALVAVKDSFVSPSEAVGASSSSSGGIT
jgi:hypothetical protein